MLCFDETTLEYKFKIRSVEQKICCAFGPICYMWELWANNKCVCHFTYGPQCVYTNGEIEYIENDEFIKFVPGKH